MTRRAAITSIAAASGTTANIAVPAGAAALDIAVFGLYLEITSAITPPDGTWTNKADLNTSSTTRGRIAVYWKRLTGADSGTYNWSFASSFRAAACGLWTGRATSGDPFDGTPGAQQNTSTSTSANTSTIPAASGGDSVGFWSNFNGGGTFNALTNYVEAFDAGVLCMETRDNTAAGSTGTIGPVHTITDFMKGFLGTLAAAGAGPSPLPPRRARQIVMPTASQTARYGR